MFKARAQFLILAGFIIAVALLRVLPHEANFSSATALAFFAVVAFPKRGVGFLIAIVALVISDLILGFYPGIEFNYLGYALIGLTGLFYSSVQKREGFIFSGLSLVVSLFSGAVLFFAVSNLGVWFSETLYPRTFEGLVECYLMAIPFFKATLISHAIFGVAFVAGWSLLTRANSAVKTVKQN